MRCFALYLPQFHETAENNEWWGQGFTEWTHVNGAKPIYPGHRQPIVPLDKNYYNLMDKKTVEWQTDLMKSYGIDGFVYYHYYFRGRKLLNKPAENLLEWTDIRQPFFFCWANHTWYQAKNGIKKVLLEQTYGTQTDWEDHFQYLLPFFRDDRYEKKDNKPVFMVYICDFPEKHAMMTYFDRRCKEEGFPGIYVIENFSNASNPNNYLRFRQNLCPQTGNVCIREPNASQNTYSSGFARKYSPQRVWLKAMRILSNKGVISWVDTFSGNKLYKIMLKDRYLEADVCHGIFFSWDNTPRHGVRGYVITPPSKERFLRYADSIRDDDYVFINAWNEWAEGMILEPTEHDGYKYLEWIQEWKQKND